MQQKKIIEILFYKNHNLKKMKNFSSKLRLISLFIDLLLLVLIIIVRFKKEFHI